MSDLAAAAAAIGVPEALVQRSAEARAQETGASVEEILAAWAGGGSAPAAATPPAAAEASPPSEPEVATAAPEVVIEAPAIETPPPAAPAPAPAASGKPPVLVGTGDNPLAIMVAAVGLFALIFLVGFVGPSLQADTPGARSSDMQLSTAAEDGLALYGSLGCSACHTQMVRPVVADVGLGGVTLNDANQPLGTRRFGPDLSNVGSRLSKSQMEATVSGFGGHPSWSLSGQDLDVLVAYLLESDTSGGG